MKEKKTEKPKKKKKKTKAVYVDDGHTVYNMDGVGGARHYENDKEKAGLSKKEKRAAIRAAFETYLPSFILIILSFTAAALIVYLWLK